MFTQYKKYYFAIIICTLYHGYTYSAATSKYENLLTIAAQVQANIEQLHDQTGCTYQDAVKFLVEKNDRKELAKIASISDKQRRLEPRYVQRYRTHIKYNKLEHCCSINCSPQLDKKIINQIINGYPQALQEDIKNHLSPEFFDTTRSRHYLLSGAPGVGKSSIGGVLSAITRAPLLYIRSTSIETEWKASEIQNLERLLKPITHSNDPWIILLDEMDSMERKSGNTEENFSTSKALQGVLDHNKNSNLIIIGTTNHIENIHPALINRHSTDLGTYEIPLPNFDTRKNILKIYLDQHNMQCPDDVLNYMAKCSGGWFSTGGLTGRELKAIIIAVGRTIRQNIRNKIPLSERTTENLNKALEEELLPLSFDQAREGIELLKARLKDGNLPTTLYERKWKKFRNSKDFLPIINTTLSGCNTLISAIGTGSGIYSAIHQLKLAYASFELSKEGLEHQRIASQVGLEGLSQGRENIALGKESLKCAQRGNEQADTANLIAGASAFVSAVGTAASITTGTPAPQTK